MKYKGYEIKKSEKDHFGFQTFAVFKDGNQFDRFHLVRSCKEFIDNQIEEPVKA